ncbi:MAG: hypothetical protein KBD04_03585 [Proteobacteria bacterium]|nr:hypothetical protein [Pseudomonadota bacterium]
MALGTTFGASKIDTPIFDDSDTLGWYATKNCSVIVEIKIASSGGGAPDISSQETLDSAHIPNTLKEFYDIFPQLREKINAIYAHKDDYYLMISEILSEPGCKEKISSFIGAYAREIK